MASQQEPRVCLPPLEQIGIVVEDIDRAIEHYGSTFGWGPFKIREVQMEGFTYRSQLGDCRLKIAYARSGPVQIELIQVLEGETPHTDFLSKKGEGLHHLAFRVDDLHSMLSELAKDNVEPVFHHSHPEGAIAYLNSDKIGGVMFELIEVKKRSPV